MSTARRIISGDCAVRISASTTPCAKTLTGLLFLVSVLSLQGCFLTARVWKEDHPNGIREANVACVPVSAVRDGTGVVVTVRLTTTMATRGYRGYSEKKHLGYADRNLTAGDVVFLKSRPQQPCVPDDRVWKATCSQALSVRVSGKGERWSGSLHNGANINASLDFQTSRVAFAEIPKPDIKAIEALSERTTWLGRTFHNLLSQPLSGGRRANKSED